MKRLLTLIMSILLVCCLTACGNDEQSAETESTDLSAVTEQTEQTTEATTDPTTEPTECSHKYTETVTVEATCTEVGELTYTCELCGDSYTEEIEKLEHDYKDATCTAPKTCASCGATEGEKLGHSYKQTASKEATCTAEGSKTYTCSKCSYSYTEKVAKTAHDYKVTTTKEATCTAEGSKTYTCSKCGGSYTEKVAKTAHDYKVTTTKDATCTAEGSKTYTCSKCGGSYTETIAKIAHSYKDATCTAPKTCTSCGATDGEALGHSYKDATCTAPKTCTTCGATEGAALGHDYVDGVCTICGDSLKGQLGYSDGTLTGYALSDDGKVLYYLEFYLYSSFLETHAGGLSELWWEEYDLIEYSSQEELDAIIAGVAYKKYNDSYYLRDWDRCGHYFGVGYGIKGNIVEFMTGYGTEDDAIIDVIEWKFEIEKISNTQYKLLTKPTGIYATEEATRAYVPGMILTWTAD